MKPMTYKQASKEHAFQAVVKALVANKEIKTRFQNGENLKQIAKEKGFEIVLPL